MLSYVYFGTNDLDKATAFYDATLAPLGMRRCVTNDPQWDRISAGWGIYEEAAASIWERLLRRLPARSRWQQSGRCVSRIYETSNLRQHG